MNRRQLFPLVGAALSASVAPRVFASSPSEGISAAAHALYERSIVFDANLAPPLPEAFPVPPELVRTVLDSGVSGAKTSMGGSDLGFEDTLGEIAFFLRLIEAAPETFLQIRTAADFERAKRERRFGILFSFESTNMLDGKLDRIELFRDLGVRVMQLSYNLTSPFAAGVLANPPTGLTDLGRQAVEAMNAQGVTIDISHANGPTSAEVIALSKTPALITHAGCAAIHAHPRNKPDALLKAVAAKGGCVGIYDLPYLVASPKQPTLADYLAHLTHALGVCGEDHVGIGSDSGLEPFDLSPKGLEELHKALEHRQKTGVAAPEEDRPMYVIGLNLPRRSEVIADGLLKRGYSERVAEKVLGLNFTQAIARSWG